MSVIEMTAVHKRFGDVTALDGVDLEVGRGELVAVLGPNGAGKTTMFELILGLTAPTSGKVKTLDSRPGHRAASLRTGAMLQSAGLPENVTATELVRLVAAGYDLSLGADEALRRVGLGARSKRKVTALSGGERQRILLAIAIVGIPDLLLLDEPTTAMDTEARRSFWVEATSAVEKGTTLVFATHDLAEADAVAQRVVVLQDGRIVADSTPAEMKSLISPKTVTFRTTADRYELMGLPHSGAVEVDRTSGLVRVHTLAPEQLVATMVQRGHPIDDLLVTEADLEDAFASLLASGEAS